jgi:hypothetical protein
LHESTANPCHGSWGAQGDCITYCKTVTIFRRGRATPHVASLLSSPCIHALEVLPVRDGRCTLPLSRAHVGVAIETRSSLDITICYVGALSDRPWAAGRRASRGSRTAALTAGLWLGKFAMRCDVMVAVRRHSRRGKVDKSYRKGLCYIIGHLRVCPGATCCSVRHGDPFDCALARTFPRSYVLRASEGVLGVECARWRGVLGVSMVREWPC